jgi:hypothetical protein
MGDATVRKGPNLLFTRSAPHATVGKRCNGTKFEGDLAEFDGVTGAGSSLPRRYIEAAAAKSVDMKNAARRERRDDFHVYTSMDEFERTYQKKARVR